MTDPIRLGELNSYSLATIDGFTGPYLKGLQLGIERVNASGGVLGRPLELISRDDRFEPAFAASVAQNLIDDGVDLLLGAFNSDVALAIAEVATRNKTIFVAGEPRTDDLVWRQGSRYVFRIRTSQSMMSKMLIDMIAKLPHRRWAMLCPEYRFARKFAGVFKAEVSQIRPDIDWIDERIFNFGHFDAVDALDWIERNSLDAVFTPLLGQDLVNFAREGNRRGTFHKCMIVDPLAGEPEYLIPLAADTPENWMVLGYPAEQDLRLSNQVFCEEYRRYAGVYPTLGSLIGYLLIEVIAKAIDRAGIMETEALVAALEGLKIDSPLGDLRIRAADHQATMGAWIGYLTCREGKGVMRDWTFLQGEDYLPTEAEALRLRF